MNQAFGLGEYLVVIVVLFVAIINIMILTRLNKMTSIQMRIETILKELRDRS